MTSLQITHPFWNGPGQLVRTQIKRSRAWIQKIVNVVLRDCSFGGVGEFFFKKIKNEFPISSQTKKRKKEIITCELVLTES